MAISQDEMLRAIHQKDPKTLNKRYSPQELQAKYAQMFPGKASGQQGQPAQPAPAPFAADVVTNPNNPTGIVNSAADVAGAAAAAGNLANNANQVDQFGNKTTVTVDPATGQATQSTALSGANQAVLGGIQGNAQAAGNALGGILQGGILGSITQPSALGGAAAGGFTGQAAPISNYEQAYYGQLTAGLDQQKAQAYNDKKQELANRGIPVGSQAFDSEMNRFDKSWSDQFQNAKNQAVTAGAQLGLQSIPVLGSAASSGFFGATPQQVSGNYDFNSIFAMLEKAGVDKASLDLAKKKLNQGGGGGAAASTPFIGGAAPGF